MDNFQSEAQIPVELLDDALKEAIHLLKNDHDWNLTISKIKESLEKKDTQQVSLADRIMMQDSPKYSLLLGFCYILEINTPKDINRAFEIWEKDDTFYGNYLIGKCYNRGWG